MQHTTCFDIANVFRVEPNIPKQHQKYTNQNNLAIGSLFATSLQSALATNSLACPSQPCHIQSDKMKWLSPFKRYKLEDFDSVYVPLDRAVRHPSVVAENQRRASISTLVDDSAAEKGTPKERTEKDAVDGTDKTSDTGKPDALTIESLRAEIEADISASGHDSAYDRKSKVVNKAIQDIGMGWYQWELFILCGFGWFADNLWLQTVAITLPSLSDEFGISETNVRFTTLSTFVGLCCGALFWGVTADVIGRRPAFNLTLLITGIFGCAVGGGHTWIAVCGLYAALGAGIGGNLPVDGALFLEFLPFSNGNLLTFLSIFWPVGQLYSSLVGWGFLTNYSENQGWRYLNYTMGATTLGMFLCRFALFHLFESPKFYLSKGRQRDAVLVVRAIAYINGTKTWISEEILNEIGGTASDTEDQKLSNMEIIKRAAGKFSTQRIKPLFAYKRLAINTLLLFTIWTCIGMAYPLFNAFIVQYLEAVDPNAPPTPPSILYRNYAIQSVIGCPGSAIAAYTVNIKYVGRRGTMAVSLLLTGIFLYLFTISADADYQLGFSCMVAFFQNTAYGVLFAYSPETFPAPNRSTGTGISSGLNRLAGLCAPLVAI